MFDLKMAVLAIVVATPFLTISPESNAGGLLGDTLKWVGDRTGVKPISKTGKELDNASRDIKKEAPIIGDVEEAVSRPVRETAKWVDNNKETVAAVAVVAAVGWAACADGCTFVGSVIAGGAAIPVFSSDDSNEDQQPNQSTRGTPSPQPPSDKDIEEHEEYKDQNTPKVEVYPYYKRDGRYDFRPPIATESGEFGEPAIDAEVSMPTQDWEIRDNRQGHIFASRKAGGGMRRNHGGIDVKAQPGDQILATMTGHVERQQNPYADFPSLTGVRIVNDKGFSSGVYYVELSNEIKEALTTGKKYKVKAGETRLGVAQNPADYPKNKGIDQHVHAYWEDPAGRKVSPDGQIAIESKPK